MSGQTTLDKLKTIGEWLFQNKDALRKDNLSVQYSILRAQDDGGAHVFGVHITNEDNLWLMLYDVLKEFYMDHDDYDSFADYMNDFTEHCLAWFDAEAEDADFESLSLAYHPEDSETEEIGDLFGSEED